MYRCDDEGVRCTGVMMLHESLIPLYLFSSSSSRSGKDSSSFVPTPMPDLSGVPIDPNEPTYCLCRQVSFGEMIGCDNEDVGFLYLRCVTFVYFNPNSVP